MALGELLNEMVKKFPNIEVSLEKNILLICYKGERYEHEFHDTQEIEKIEKLLNILNKLAISYPEIDVIIHDEECIVLHSVMWKGDFEINLDINNFDQIDKIINITQYVKTKDSNIVISLNVHFNGSFHLDNGEWRRSLVFGEEIEIDSGSEILNTTIDNIRKYFEFNYIERECCYDENYIEFPIMISNTYEGYFGMFEELHSVPDKLNDKGITFEISKISEHFWNHSLKEQRAEGEEIYEETRISSLKIYNMNNFLNIQSDNPSFLTKGYDAAKNILFKLAHQYTVHLDIVKIPDFDDESFLDHHYEEMESFDSINEHELFKLYDKDLINYYYQAMKMEESEFKYLAYYQILECIFDEVHLYATVQDVKHIINSDWFSKHCDEDIKIVIEMVDTYNKKRNDREKLTLVLENYFRGSLHDKAFLTANRSIIYILKEMKLIKDDKDLKDLKKVVDIIYDFRCKCTHSNRTFPVKRNFEDSNHELKNYINLIKKLTEKIIINYEKK